MNRSILRRFVTLTMMLFVGVAFSIGADSIKDSGKLKKVETNDQYSFMTINSIFNMYSNNGDGSYNKYLGIAGLEWPKGTSKTAIFEDGLLYGGYFRGVLHTGGSAYRHAWESGPILTPGTTTSDPVKAPPGDAQYRPYRVRPDVNPNTPLDDKMKQMLQTGEVALINRYVTSSTVQSVYDDYIKDWKEWPVANGAPYVDVNGNGTYDWQTDIPGFPGAGQTIWFVSNDLDDARVKNLYGAGSIGIELQQTIWAYNRSGPLGNCIFSRYRLINKSGSNIDSMYTMMWSDPDLGDAKDDYVGCDTTLSLGFVYNGKPTDAMYFDKPPAAGYDFFQGPKVPSPGDTAMFNLKRLPGFKNLGMSSFNFFINGNALYTDPTQGSIIGTTELYNLMKGLITTTGADNINPLTLQPTKFAFSGDPVAKTGWIDGTIFGSGTIQSISPDDRRMAMTAGPFTFAAGDTQEVVVATIVAQGSDNINSVSLLKSYDVTAQTAYRDNFALATPPEKPYVRVAQLDNKIVLDWGEQKTAQATEVPVSKGYAFQGYNIYQLKSNSFSASNIVKLSTVDVVDSVGYIFDDVFDEGTGVILNKPVQFGKNTGISRKYIATTNGFDGSPLVNGRSYFFAVTAYSYNPNEVPKTLESSPTVIEVIPQSLKSGTRVANDVSDSLLVTHTGPSPGRVKASVVDPLRMAERKYSVTFDTLTYPDAKKTSIVWNLKDFVKDSVIFSKIGAQSVLGVSIPGLDNNFFTVEGLEIRISTGLFQMTGGGYPDGTTGPGRWTNKGGVIDSLSLEGFSGSIGNAFDHWPAGTTVLQEHQRNILIKFAATLDSNGTISPTDSNSSYGARYLFNADQRKQASTTFPIINPTKGLPYQDYKLSVPFAAYDIESTPPRRLMVGFTENNARYGTANSHYWPPSQTQPGSPDINADPNGPLEWFFIFDRDYKETVDSSLMVNMATQSAPLMWVGTPAFITKEAWLPGETFTINRSFGNGLSDVFTFTSSAPTSSQAAMNVDVERINVFPNPYFGFNSQELNKYNRFVTFNHLPQQATIRIFNLSGVLLKTITKNDDSQFARWDLRNEAALPAAAGVYIVHIDMPAIGKQKILKLAIVPEAQFLDKY